jgi:hypothetical protein
MFQLYELLSNFFSQSPEFDEDGFAHFLLEEIDDGLDVDITPIYQWQTINMDTKLILDCDAASTFALSWMIAGKERLQIQPLQVRDVKFIHETDQPEIGVQQDIAFLEIQPVAINGRVIRLQLLPDLSVQFVVDTNEDEFRFLN